jgi:uncharacterized protein
MTSEQELLKANPVSLKERITILDSLRGIAILGILMMNIPGFGLPEPAYGDPTMMNETNTINFKVWYFIDWFFEGSQRALFSMLFGAGIILFISRLEKRTDGMWPADYFFRRQLWLLVFGLFNAFVLLWFWDILFHYACCGMIMFAFRRMAPKTLLIAAFVCFVLGNIRSNVDLYRDKKMIAKGEVIAKMDTSVSKLTEKQKEALGAMTEFKEKSSVDGRKKKMEKSLKAMRGSYGELYDYQSERSLRGELYYMYFGLWDILLFMFIGMALFKTGLLMGKGSVKTYLLMTVVGLGGGLIISWFRLQPLIDLKFNNFDVVKHVKWEYYDVSRAARAIGIFGVYMLMYKSGLFKWFFALLRPVGQMAFTNYLTQSLFVGLYFYGVGFGKFGYLQRYEIYIVVAVVYAVQIIWSHIWLHYFRFGPLEWAWRSLTYGKLQPFKKADPGTDSMGIA